MFPVRKINIATNMNCLIYDWKKIDNENKLLNCFFLRRKKINCGIKVSEYYFAENKISDM